MRRLLPLLALAAALGASTPGAARADFSPVFFTLGAAKVPGIAFDIVGGARLGPSLSLLDQTDALRRSARASFASNWVTLGLHSVSIGALWVASLGDFDLEERLVGAFSINAVADITIGVLGLVTGIDLLLQRNAAGLTGTELGTAATWSAAVNIAMGSFGVLWFLPMTIGALVGATDIFGSVDRSGPTFAIVPNGAGAALIGRF